MSATSPGHHLPDALLSALTSPMPLIADGAGTRLGSRLASRSGARPINPNPVRTHPLRRGSSGVSPCFCRFIKSTGGECRQRNLWLVTGGRSRQGMWAQGPDALVAGLRGFDLVPCVVSRPAWLWLSCRCLHRSCGCRQGTHNCVPNLPRCHRGSFFASRRQKIHIARTHAFGDIWQQTHQKYRLPSVVTRE